MFYVCTSDVHLFAEDAACKEGSLDDSAWFERLCSRTFNQLFERYDVASGFITDDAVVSVLCASVMQGGIVRHMAKSPHKEHLEEAERRRVVCVSVRDMRFGIRERCTSEDDYSRRKQLIAKYRNVSSLNSLCMHEWSEHSTF